jgi:hypothetical protein
VVRDAGSLVAVTVADADPGAAVMPVEATEAARDAATQERAEVGVSPSDSSEALDAKDDPPAFAAGRDATDELLAPVGGLARTRTLTGDTIDAYALAADQTGVYWISLANELWSLPAAATTPRRLATDVAGIADECSGGRSMLAVTDTSIFWHAAGAATLHRTSKDGTTDGILVSGLRAATNLIVDDTRVFWSEVQDQYCQGAEIIRSVLQTAGPGTAPATLYAAPGNQEMWSLAALAGVLYWTPFDAVGATMYYADLWSAPIAPLLDGIGAASLGLADKRPYVLFADVGALYVGYFQDSWTTIVGHFAPDDHTIQPVATLPVNVDLLGIAIAGPWLVATSMGEIGQSRLYVAPLRGAGFVIVAEHVRTVAAMGPAGVTFVDGAGRLLVISMADLDAAANSAVP